MNADFYEALALLEEEKGIPQDYMLEKIRDAIEKTVKRDRNVNPENVIVTFDREKASFRVCIRREVVEEVTPENMGISLPDAKRIDAKYELGDFVEQEYDTTAVGRIAAKVGKNVIIQAIREAVDGSMIKEFEELRGKLVTGVVKRIEPNRTVYLEIGKNELPLYSREQIPGETFYEGQFVKVCVTDIRKNTKNQEVVLSRASSDFIRTLFAVEVPEIQDGVVTIKAISREAGQRTKVAVYAEDPNVDAVGACIGPQQSRINAILENLNGERIDLIKYYDDPTKYIPASLSPAVVSMLEIDPVARACRVCVPADKLSLAIGKTGQNVRLAAKLTEYKIDIVSE